MSVRAVARVAFSIVALGTWLVEARAHAQLRWDVGGEVGAMQRVMKDAPSGSVPDPGPTAELRADIALLPLLMAGPYAEYDLVPGPIVRHTAEAGLRIKLTPPLFARPWTGWIVAGVGVARSVEPSHDVSVASGGPPTLAEVPTTAGLILDAPVGVGVGTRLADGWTLYAEVSGRIGALFSGPLYDRPLCPCDASAYVGRDALAASLSVGLSLDE